MGEKKLEEDYAVFEVGGINIVNVSGRELDEETLSLLVEALSSMGELIEDEDGGLIVNPDLVGKTCVVEITVDEEGVIVDSHLEDWEEGLH